MFKNDSCLVLSPGRTGCTILTNLINKKFYKKEIIVTDDSLKECLINQQLFIGKTYDLFRRADFPNVHVVYSIRENVIDSILSRLIATQFQTWLPGPPMAQRVYPFVTSEDEVLKVTYHQVNWYNNYRQFLKPNSTVVIYEILQQLINFENVNCVDKKSVIQNYDETIDIIKSLFTKNFLYNHEEFIDYKRRLNRQEIYHWLQHS
jgi:hypothetical protein